MRLKFGGEPFGLPDSLWPKSRQTGQAMQFICQIPFGPELFTGVAESVAYLFMTCSGEVGGAWLPDGGENALVVVPRERVTASFTVGEAPRLSRMVKKWWKKVLVPEVCVFEGSLTPSDDPVFVPESRLLELPETEATAYREAVTGNKLGGTPGFLQGDELPFPEPWHLLLQLDSATVPFWINFGDTGIGYAFLNGDGTKGKFLWQCC